MDLRGKKFVVIGGAGLIGSHAIDELVKEDIGEILIYDNFTRGSHENLEDALKDPRARPRSKLVAAPTSEVNR